MFGITPNEDPDGRVSHAIDRLKSIHDGDAGVVESVALGPEVIPALLATLVAREPSGLFQARCRAIEALAALKAFSVLGDFLRLSRDIQDPVERLGEDAVVSAAAFAIANLREKWVFELLADLAQQRPLRGVLAGLGVFASMESLPIFVNGLGEDELRLTSETILRGFGVRARPALITAALERGQNDEWERNSHLRKRRRALALLSHIGISRRDWPRLRPLVDEADAQLALLACEMGLKAGNAEDRNRIGVRMQALRQTAGWMHRERIDKLMTSLARGGTNPRRRL